MIVLKDAGQPRWPKRKDRTMADVGFSTFPKQGEYLGKRVEVCFQFDASKILLGTFVRDDAEEPNIHIIRLDDGRYILTSECMYSPLP